jgi:hypothetical protein
LKSCDVGKSGASLWVVFGDVPSAISGDVKEFGYKAGIDFVVLAVVAIAFGQSCEGLEESCLGHKSEGLRNRRGLIAVRVNEKSKEELDRGKSLSF